MFEEPKIVHAPKNDEEHEQAPKLTYTLTTLSAKVSEQSIATDSWLKEKISPRGGMRIGDPFYWSSEDGERGNTSTVRKVERQNDGSLIIHTDTSVYELKQDNTRPEQQETFKNHFKLRKISVNDGSSSVIQGGWRSEVSLLAKPEVGGTLQWKEKGSGTGNTSTISKIETTADNIWLIHTNTSIYELAYLGNETKQLATEFNVEQILQNQNTPQEVTLALQEEAFRPIESVEIDGHTFFVSPIITGGPRDVVFGYVLNDEGVAQLRMFYQSKSDGGWRLNAPNGNQEFSKGISHKKYGYRHYTKETKPHEDLVMKLDGLPIVKDKSFGADSLYEKQRSVGSEYKNEENLAQYASETEPVENYPLRNEHSGLPMHFEILNDSGLDMDGQIQRGQILYENKPIDIESVRGINYPPGFIPDFTKEPVRTYYQSHTLLSAKNGEHPKQDIRVEVYESTIKGEDDSRERLFWHMALSPEGEVWIEKIIPESSKINSFGVYNQVYDFGVLDLKPLDYTDQVKPIPGDYKVLYQDRDYEDITPFLSELLPIKLYKQYRQH